MSDFLLQSAELTDSQFNQISDLVKKLCGINLHDGKKELVKSRLNKRLRTLGFTDFDQYLDLVRGESGPAEITLMLDAISTNLTYFFREGKHFDFLREQVLPHLARRPEKKIRFWSAGCSSGEEPYSLAITIQENLPTLAGWDVGILATDLSTKVLAIADRGLYTPERFRETPPPLISRYFTCLRNGQERHYRVIDAVRRMITFARLNLMESWPMRGSFDVIFCRNVMIYFDKATQNRLVNRYWDILSPGGYLFIGHSESLAGVHHKFQYVQPTVYRKT